ncbi:MAG: nucleotidyltransferase family protein [Acholeplasmataceae bacterium]|nr:nucleotidyltransferase family protein [Acholeplasmataceae bacterium]
MTQGLILAGGYSARAKQNKMLLMFDKKPLILHAIDGMIPFVSQIFVVTGHYHDEISELLSGYPRVTCLKNRNYEMGMFSSVLTGVSALSEDFFVLPGDCPFIKSSTYQMLLSGTKIIRVPSFAGKGGHPLFMKKELLNDLKKEAVSSNLKAFRNRYDIEFIEVMDDYILTDIDTIRDFKKLIHKKEGEQSGH